MTLVDISEFEPGDGLIEKGSNNVFIVKYKNKKYLNVLCIKSNNLDKIGHTYSIQQRHQYKLTPEELFQWKIKLL